MVYIFLAFISGFMVLISMIINSHLAKKIGVFQGTFINFFMGALLTTVIILFSKNSFPMNFESYVDIPLWAFFGGLIGVIIVSISNVIVPRIPTIYTTLLIFIGQLLTGLIVDYFVGSNISIGKLIGGALILMGLLFNFKVDKKYSVKKELLTADKQS